MGKETAALNFGEVGGALGKAAAHLVLHWDIVGYYEARAVDQPHVGGPE